MEKMSGLTLSCCRGGQIGFVLGLVAYLILAVLAYHHPYFDWDVAVTGYIQSITFPGFQNVMVWVSVVGTNWVPVLLVVLVAGGLWMRGWRREAEVCGAGVGAGFLFNRLLKMVVARPRPVDALVDVSVRPGSESYPSGHVVFFVAFFGFLAFLSLLLLRHRTVRAGLTLLFVVLILLVGCSRVYLGAHWPSDVLGAYLGGALWLMAMIEVYGRWPARGRGTRPSPDSRPPASC